MKPTFDLFGRILVHNSSIQCFPLRGNQKTESCVCMVPGPVAAGATRYLLRDSLKVTPIMTGMIIQRC